MRSQQSFMSFMNSKDGGMARRDMERLCCAKCRFSTRDVDLFARHVSHHKEVTFSCALCSHVSYSKTESQKHVVEHTGSYPYRCSFCSYGAVRRDYMVKHILRIHKRNAEDGIITEAGLITEAAFPFASAPETLRASAWPRCPAPDPHTQQQDAAPQSGPSGSHTCAGPTVAQTSTRGTGPANTDPFSSTPASTSLTPHVVLRSREENANSPFNMSKSCNRRVVLEKPVLKPTFPRVPCEPLIPEKATHPKAIPRVQIRPPAGVNATLRPLLNMLSKRNDQRVGLIKDPGLMKDPGLKKDQRAGLIKDLGLMKDQRAGLMKDPGPMKDQRVGLMKDPGPMKDLRVGLMKDPGLMKDQRVGLLNGTNVAMRKTTAAIPSHPVRRPPSERSRTSSGSGSSSVQVELLAPLNQPIQHNRPLTVSCPEEINIPAGCLVELVEVKNVNGTRELELRMVPSAGAPPQQRASVRSQESPVSPSASHASATNTHTRSKHNLRDRVIKHPAAPLSSEGLPVISSVFSLCPTSKETQTETQPETKEPQGDMRRAAKPVCGVLVQKPVCNLVVKKEEPEEKNKGLELKQTKMEDEEPVDSSVPEAPMKTDASDDPKQHVSPAPTVPIAPNTRDASHPETESQRKDGQHCVSLMYPKVSLVRIPSSVIEPVPKHPDAQPPAPSVTARPVLCCSLLEQNVSIKLILKRDLRQSEERDPPPRKKHKKDKRRNKKRRSETGPPRPSAPLRSAALRTGPPLRLTPLKAGQRVSCPGPNQPVVVLNHPSPARVSVHTLETYAWARSAEERTHTQPSLKMKLKKLHGHTYRVMELVLRG